MTVGEMKKKLEGVPDDLEIVSYQSGMEKSGIMKAYPMCERIKVREEQRSTWDRFDGGEYSYTEYVKDENGTKEVFRI